MSFWFLIISLILIAGGLFFRRFYISSLDSSLIKSDLFFRDLLFNLKNLSRVLLNDISYFGLNLSKKNIDLFKRIARSFKRFFVKYTGAGIETFKESREKSVSFFLQKMSEIEKKDIEKDL